MASTYGGNSKYFQGTLGIFLKKPISQCKLTIEIKGEKMERKPIQMDVRTWRIIRLESFRQSSKKGYEITMGDVLNQFANKLNKKYKYLKG